ncbi:MAG: alpha/beta hydrolase [Pseudomonadota bacterium]
MSETIITHDGLSLAYEDAGDGEPVLCLPGLTRNARDFDDLAAAWARPVRLIRLTSRGREGSDWAPDPMTYSIPVEARDVITLLDHLGLARATIIGTSRGGLIAMALAAFAQTKARLSAVVLNDVGPVLDPLGLERIKGYLGVRPKARNVAEQGAALAHGMGAGFPDLTTARWEALAARWFKPTETGMDLRYDPKLRDAVLAQGAQPSPDLWPFFEAFEGLPLGLIRGENSDLLSVETATEMVARQPRMIWRDVPGRGHTPFLDEPESLEVLDAVLAQVTP